MTEVYFPNVIDNSARKEWVKCQMNAHWKLERGLNAEIGNEHLHAGGAFASGVEAMRKSYYDKTGAQQGNQAMALQVGLKALYEAYGGFVPPAKSVKTAARMAGALAHYASRFPLDEEKLVPIVLGDSLGVEQGFQFEIPIEHPLTGERLSYCGRFDMLAKDENGYGWVVDEKTTGRLGDSWAHQWDLDAGLTGYCWGAQKLLDANDIDCEVKGAIVNGVAIGKYDYESVRVSTFRQGWEIERWYGQMLKDVEGWKAAFLKRDHSMVMDHGCALYNNPCQFAKLCKSVNPERLEGSYSVRFWNPVSRMATVNGYEV